MLPADKWTHSPILKGVFTARAVTPVYHLFGKQGIEQTAQPQINHSIGTTVRYHVRSGGHDVTAYDWDLYLAFAQELP